MRPAWCRLVSTDPEALGSKIGSTTALLMAAQKSRASAQSFADVTDRFHLRVSATRSGKCPVSTHCGHYLESLAGPQWGRKRADDRVDGEAGTAALLRACASGSSRQRVSWPRLWSRSLIGAIGYCRRRRTTRGRAAGSRHSLGQRRTRWPRLRLAKTDLPLRFLVCCGFVNRKPAFAV